MKILALDIETRPSLAYVWSLWDQNVPLDRLIESGDVICFAAKWIGHPKMYFYSVHRDREEMIREAYALLEEADAVLHYNGARFDIPHLNRLFVENGLTPPAPFHQIDLLSVVKKRFRFPSNKLAYVSTALGLEGKVSHSGFDLWIKCMAGDDKAWKQMEKYNRRDVALLEELYEILKPWIPNHPSHRVHDGPHNLHDGTDLCSTCGEHGLIRRGYYRTRVAVYQRWQCQKCGVWVRSTRSDETTDVTQAVL